MDSVPPVMSEWPPMNLVALVMLTSAPSASGRWNTGAMMLLSTTTSAPACALGPVVTGFAGGFAAAPCDCLGVAPWRLCVDATQRGLLLP
jgi:hypothetical protein